MPLYAYCGIPERKGGKQYCVTERSARARRPPLGSGFPPGEPIVIDQKMTTHQFIAGTDVASIGIWDRKWSDPSIRGESPGKFLKRLPADAERRRLFYIETGGDGQSSIEVHVNDQLVPDQNYRKVPGGYAIDITSGEAVIDGLEWYGSEYALDNVFQLEKGIYAIDVFVLKDPELEESEATQDGQPPTSHILEKFAIVGLLSFAVSVYLFFKRQFLIAALLLALSLLHSYLLHRIEKARKSAPRAKVKVNATVPYLVICMRKSEGDKRPGGYVSLDDATQDQ